MNAQVSVEVLNDVSANELQALIKDHLNAGYKIQDSQVQWYQGQIEGVYVFVKEKGADE